MQYNKNTLTPIADAARFFSERNGRINYEDRMEARVTGQTLTGVLEKPLRNREREKMSVLSW